MRASLTSARREDNARQRVCLSCHVGEVETSLDGSETVRDLIRSLPVRSAAGPPVYVAASPTASFSTAFRRASLRSEQTVIARRFCPAFDCVYFDVGKPAAFQALKPPAMERTLL